MSMDWPVWMKRPFCVPPPKKLSPLSFSTVCVVALSVRLSACFSRITVFSPTLTDSLAVALSSTTVVSPEVISNASPASFTVALGCA